MFEGARDSTRRSPCLPLLGLTTSKLELKPWCSAARCSAAAVRIIALPCRALPCYRCNYSPLQTPTVPPRSGADYEHRETVAATYNAVLAGLNVNHSAVGAAMATTRRCNAVEDHAMHAARAPTQAPAASAGLFPWLAAPATIPIQHPWLARSAPQPQPPPTPTPESMIAAMMQGAMSGFMQSFQGNH
jgi:hypothetical protein